MTATVTAPFNEYNLQMRELIEYHLQLPEIRVILALRFQPERLPEDVFLFEVIDNFGAGLLDDKKTLFEIAYDSSEEFPMKAHSQLHLVLTHPVEIDLALREQWPSAQEIRNAVLAGKCETLFSDAEGKQILERLRG